MTMDVLMIENTLLCGRICLGDIDGRPPRGHARDLHFGDANGSSG
jgi:hypothetical protein